MEKSMERMASGVDVPVVDGGDGGDGNVDAVGRSRSTPGPRIEMSTIPGKPGRSVSDRRIQESRDFIDSDPTRNQSTNGYLSDSEYDSDDYDSGYESFDDRQGCCTSLYFRLDQTCRTFRWKIRNRGSRKGTMQPGRLLDRDNAFHQCSGRLHVNQTAHGRTQTEILALYSEDWFHVLLSVHTWQLLLFMITLYTCNLLVFSGFYMAVDRPGQNCGIASDRNESVPFQTAFGFSLITSSTIGYGFPASADPFFHDCVGLVVIVYFQVIVSLGINALVVGLVLQRLGRADSRSHQVVFSDKAVIRCIHGNMYYMFQVYDLDRRHPVVEAHVRVYAVFHSTDGTNRVNYQTRFMRLQNPNDELGSVLFLSVPCTVVHCIDQWSPLMPPKESRDMWGNANDNFVHNAANRFVFPGLILRESDAECGARDGASCPICGETFPTDQHLLRHIRYMRWEELHNGVEPMTQQTVDALADDVGTESENEDGETEDEELVKQLPDRTADAFKEKQKQNPYLRKTVAEMDKKQQGSTGGSAMKFKKEGKVTEDIFVETGQRSKVNRLLKFYGDLSMPITHQDVDMKLMQTELDLVPERDERKKKAPPNQGNIFSMFDKGEDGKKAKETKGDIASNSVSPLPSPRGMHESRNFKPKTATVDAFRDSIKNHIEKSRIEIIVLVEGIEARSSNTFQARHSYSSDNIEFDKFFAPAMQVSETGHAQVDLNSFHRVIPTPSMTAEATCAQSHC